jgi:hypothetical protein
MQKAADDQRGESGVRGASEERLTWALTVARDLRERPFRTAVACGLLARKRTEVQTPPAPTTPALSRAFAGLSVQLWMGWAGEDGSAVGRALITGAIKWGDANFALVQLRRLRGHTLWLPP